MKKDRQAERNLRMVPDDFAGDGILSPPGHPYAVVRHELSPVRPATEGYDPYNNPPPAAPSSDADEARQPAQQERRAEGGA
jgi:hypothetical protein